MKYALLFSFFLFSLIAKGNGSPLHVLGSNSAVTKLVDILNNEMLPVASVQAQLLDAYANEFGIFLVRKLENRGFVTREGRLRCTLNYLLEDSVNRYRIQLVENDPNVLIGDGRKSIIDIADVEKFNSSSDHDFTAINVLIHELYEQYQLQVVQKLRPGRISTKGLRIAHLMATQKESNLYSLTMLRAQADITAKFIHIEFTSRLTSTHQLFYAYYKRGNIVRVEKVDPNNPVTKSPRAYK